MSTQVTDLTIKGEDCEPFFIRAELWRTVNSVGRWLVTLDNTGNRYNAVGFDGQDAFRIDIGTTLMRGVIDGPGVTFMLADAVDDSMEILTLQGVDQMQDMMFHSDFEREYPENAGGQQIKAVLQDIYNTPRITTNITYAWPPGVTPTIGGIEFREGGSFLGAIQELHRRANYLFFVDDALALQSGAPGFDATGVTITEGVNILKKVDWNRKRLDKLYNYVKLYGKNPQFDAWTEFNAGSWGGWPFPPTDDMAITRVGTYSLRQTNTLPALNPMFFQLNAPVFNYPANGFDLTKGKIGVWAYYDNVGGGVAPQQMRVNCRLIDNAGGIADYFGTKSQIYEDHWGFCEFPLGEDYNASGVLGWPDRWNVIVAGTVFNWDQVDQIRFYLPRPSLGGNQPFNFYIDGLTLPIPPIAIAENVPSQTAYRRRPFIVNRPDIRTQNALDSYATSLLAHHKDSAVDHVKLMVIGEPLLRYAGQTFDLGIPTLGIPPNTVYYLTDIHHVIQPNIDVSGGYGFDYITEIEAIPVDTLALDMARLGHRSVRSAYQVAGSGGTGLREK